jgi:parallel beta-helix repeat protein
MFKLHHVSAKDYHVSSTGNDGNSGLSSSTPFRTLEKINQLTLLPGDRVLLKRGDTFYGQLVLNESGTATSLIEIDAYGTGPNPIIDGTMPLQNWRVSYKTMYVADLPSAPGAASQIFCDQQLMQPARFPNAGFLTVEAESNQERLCCSALTQADNYWAGAWVVCRKERWIYEIQEVESSAKGILTMKSPSPYPFKPGYGFFLIRKQHQLDANKEWYHDVSAKKIFFIAPNGASPENRKVEASVFSYGILIQSQRYISIKNITFSRQALDGIMVSSSHYISISNSIFKQCFRNGIFTSNTRGSHLSILKNQFYDIGNNGIDLNPSTGTIQGNILKRIALREGMGGSGDGKYVGILAGPNSRIAENTLDSIGYCGIVAQSGDTVVRNYVRHVCLTKDDGAAIYCYKSNRIVILENILMNAIGNDQACSNKYFTAAHGIYLDDSSSYCQLRNNTVLEGDYGIFLHNSFHNVLSGNVVYDNRKAQLAIQADMHVPATVSLTGNQIEDNVFFCMQPSQVCIYGWTYKNDAQQFASYRRNYYCHPYAEVIGKIIQVPYYPKGNLAKTQVYDFRQWQLFSRDSEGKKLAGERREYCHTKALASNLLTNPDFVQGQATWYKWGSDNFNITLDPSDKVKKGASLKSSYVPTGLNAKGWWASGDFNLRKNQYYLFRMSAYGSRLGTIDLELTQNEYPFKKSDMVGTSFMLEPSVKQYEYIFCPLSDLANVRVSLFTTVYDSTCWIDDVSLVPVDIDTLETRPYQYAPIWVNPSPYPKPIVLPGPHHYLDGTPANLQIQLPPFRSLILTKNYSPVILNTAEVDEPFREASSLRLFPLAANAGSTVFVEFPRSLASSHVHYFIENTNGVVLEDGYAKTNDQNVLEISTAQLKAGFYFVTLQTGNSFQGVRMILQ